MGRNNVIGKLGARSADPRCSGVVDVWLAAKVILTRIGRPHTSFGESRNSAGVRITAADVGDFVADKEEEKFFLDDGAADRPAPLVVSQTRLCLAWRAEIGPSVKHIILPILEDRAMKGIAAALADLVENRTADSGLRGERRSGDLNFRNTFEDGVVDVAAHWQNHGRAIGKEVGVIREVAVNGNGIARVIRATAF